jgi:two-component system, NarL family, invasion response regulator UvrY
MNMLPNVRVLIVDNHFVVRQGVIRILGDRFPHATIGEASTAEEALDLVWNGTWDVVILDLMMVGRGGLDTLKRLKQSRPQMPVIVLSIHSEEEFAVRALRLGASGYLNKDSSGPEYIESVEAALRGTRYITPSVAGLLASSIAQSPKVAHATLSNREFQVLCMIGCGKTVKEVATELALSLKTISTYRSRILEKLNLRNNLEIVRYAVRHRLVEMEQTPEE